MSKVKSQKLGFTLIEALVLLFIFSLITVTFYNILSVGTRYIQNSKNRLGALSIANEKMEVARGLAYDSVGTVDGAVSGIIFDKEDVTENTRLYHVHTTVEYVQDDFDGVYPADSAFEDYKKVTITVFWGEEDNEQERVRLSSRFVPAGLEVENPGDGVLFINVFSDQPGGTGIIGSSVHVVNAETGLDTTVETDDTGNVTLMGNKVTESIQKYQITVAKNDYETVSTMPPYPTSTYNPVDVHASVIAGLVNVANIVQNKLGNLGISSVDYLGNTAIPDINFTIKGGRKIGNETAEPNRPIYNMNANEQTNSSGIKDFGAVSPGQYEIALDPLETGYALIDTDPISPFPLFSSDILGVKIKLADKNNESLLVRIYKTVEGENLPIEGAAAHLTNASGYNAIQSSSTTGTVFFPINSDAFLPGDYNLEITKTGFTTSSDSITVTDNQLKEETIILTPSP